MDKKRVRELNAWLDRISRRELQKKVDLVAMPLSEKEHPAHKLHYRSKRGYYVGRNRDPEDEKEGIDVWEVLRRWEDSL